MDPSAMFMTGPCRFAGAAQTPGDVGGVDTVTAHLRRWAVGLLAREWGRGCVYPKHEGASFLPYQQTLKVQAVSIWPSRFVV
jgi:hypothetical protein